MILALDWDGTWTAAPAFFFRLAHDAWRAGFVVVIVTNRPASWPVEGPVPEGVGVLYCNGRPKRDVVREWNDAAGPVIWVDDMPVLVDYGMAGLERLARGERR